MLLTSRRFFSSDWSVTRGMQIKPLVNEGKGKKASQCLGSESLLLAYAQH